MTQLVDDRRAVSVSFVRGDGTAPSEPLGPQISVVDGAPVAPASAQSAASARRAVVGPQRRTPWYVPGTALSVVALLLLGMCLQIGVISQISFARAQEILFDDFRSDLARATAPVGQSFVQEPGPTSDSEELLYPLGTPVAVMSVPALGIEDLVVLEGTTSGVLQRGAGHDRSSVLPGQAGWSQIFGRRWAYGAPFRDLPALKPGDEIELVTGQGEHTYQVTGIRRPGDLVPHREKDSGRLVLVTAEGSPFMPDRPVYLDAVLVSQAQPANPRHAVALEHAEEPLAGDPAAWFAILLWAQGVAAAGLGVAWARARWGRPQAWVVGVPLLTALGLGAATSIAQLLPNLL